MFDINMEALNSVGTQDVPEELSGRGRGPGKNSGAGKPKPQSQRDRMKIGLEAERNNIMTIMAADMGKVLRVKAKDEKEANRFKMRHYRALRQFYRNDVTFVSRVSLSVEQKDGNWSLKLYRAPNYEVTLEDE